jgi:hypothetical protein
MLGMTSDFDLVKALRAQLLVRWRARVPRATTKVVSSKVGISSAIAGKAPVFVGPTLAGLDGIFLPAPPFVSPLI